MVMFAIPAEDVVVRSEGSVKVVTSVVEYVELATAEVECAKVDALLPV